mgnify:CR=1 FL=1
MILSILFISLLSRLLCVSVPLWLSSLMDFTDDQIKRYARHILLKEVGGTGQARLLQSRVLVIGAGGLGSPLLLYLAAAGIGTLGVVDDDKVDLSNLQRQVVHRTASLGKPKVESAAETIAALNPDVKMVAHRERLNSGNAAALIGGYDLIADGSDNFETRFLVNDACYFAGKPLVHGGILRFDGRVTTIIPRQSACYRCRKSWRAPCCSDC